MHCVYIIENSTGILYKGYSDDFASRLEAHNSGMSTYTANKGPWHPVFLKFFTEKKEALIYEKMLKRQNTTYLKWLINSDSNELSAWSRLG